MEAAWPLKILAGLVQASEASAESCVTGFVTPLPRYKCDRRKVPLAKPSGPGFGGDGRKAREVYSPS